MNGHPLEMYRNEDIATYSFHQPAINKFVEFTTHQRATQGFYLTMRSLEELEHASHAYPSGTTSPLAVASWFMSIESMVNCILKVSSYSYESIDFNLVKTQSIGKRLGHVTEILGVDKRQLGETGLIPEVLEFATLRNEMFHDRTFDKPLQFHKTLFSPSAEDLNQIDVLQAAQIFLKLAQVLRYALSGLDLMPDIPINRNNKVFFSKVDRLFENVTMPGFIEALKKHNLTTTLPLDSPLNNIEWISKPIPGWQPLIKSDPVFEGHFSNPTPTKILEGLFDQWVETEASHIPNDRFQLPNGLDGRKRDK